jgi:hypothetical protein
MRACLLILFGLVAAPTSAQTQGPAPVIEGQSQSAPSATSLRIVGVPLLKLHSDTPEEREDILKKRGVSTGAVVPMTVPPSPAQKITPPVSEK